MMAFDLLYDKISVQDIADSIHIDVQLLMQMPQDVCFPA